ncbi:pyridoxamine 5'-phosphate oxidase family protein [Nocardioides sp. cx-173]|uniref:pyridoxamine 5'-phosphate oxidase family protein n=1 Tax=Nocardioides sp. cx-173 TaxID=2898796 RepID=UPI001E4D3FC8|nr:pyridoxamine 5'-phosphate oxidase family protein [Nocardioides sp. cx-173]MCD4524476.1 pyridoxamine 5'-phosphate oxidase family protein [Nocardioides sp. cx-173]UGB43038.1 pyridoxamine 5'-phosphate oxidase family protein [Nocardioides sp. cx-173]
MTTLSPTPRTTVARGRDRAVTDRAALLALLEDALVAHVGIDVGDHPVVLPVAFAVDPDGPDEDGTLYIHGSVAARWLTRSEGSTVCVTVTELDGLVAARSAFHHSMNYRSVVVIGVARVVQDPEEKAHALSLTVDHMVPGRAATLRPHTRKEVVATAVLAVPLHEASMKVRAGGPVDDPEDVEAGVWAGVIPVRRELGAPVPAPECATAPLPTDVVRRAGRLG